MGLLSGTILALGVSLVFNHVVSTVNEPDLSDWKMLIQNWKRPILDSILFGENKYEQNLLNFYGGGLEESCILPDGQVT